MIEIEYTKKPSITTIRAALKKAVAAGNTFIVLTWEENYLNLTLSNWGWVGRGWIGRSSGSDLANELNRAKP